LAGLRFEVLEDFLSFMTVGTDRGVRLSYRCDPSNYPRTWIGFGTSNSAEPLPSEEYASRRIIPILLNGKGYSIQLLKRYMEINRVDIWSEALWLYLNLTY